MPTPENSNVDDKNKSIEEYYIPSENNLKEEIKRVNDNVLSWKKISFSDEFFGADESVKVIVNTKDVEYVEYDCKTIKVKPRTFSVEESRNIAEALSGQTDFYKPNTILIKSDIEKLILKIRHSIAKSKQEEYTSKAEYDAAINEWEAQINILEKMYEAAPDSYTQELTDWSFHPTEYYDKYSELYPVDAGEDYSNTLIAIAKNNTESNTRYQISVNNYKNGNYYSNSLEYQEYNDEDETGDYIWNPNLELPITLSDEDSLELINKFFKRAGIEGYKLYSHYRYGAAPDGDVLRRQVLQDQEPSYYESFIFLPSYYGIPAVFQQNNKKLSNDSYGATYDFEQIKIYIKNNHIVYFKWTGPIEILGIGKSTENILSPKEIMSSFKSRMQIEYTIGKLSRISPEDRFYQEELSKIKSGEIHINDIQFGYFRVKIKDNPSDYIMIPTWEFIGEEALDIGEGYTWQSDIRPSYAISNVYQIINAIDGTIINPINGY